MAGLVSRLKIMPLTKTIRAGETKIIYLPIDKIIDEIYSNYKYLSTILQLKKLCKSENYMIRKKLS